jgi:hypothetical protein
MNIFNTRLELILNYVVVDENECIFYFVKTFVFFHEPLFIFHQHFKRIFSDKYFCLKNKQVKM